MWNIIFFASKRKGRGPRNGSLKNLDPNLDSSASVAAKNRGKKTSRCPLFQPMNWWINPLVKLGLFVGQFLNFFGKKMLCKSWWRNGHVFSKFGKRQAKQHVQYREKLKASQLTHWRQLTMQCIQYHILAIVLLGQIPCFSLRSKMLLSTTLAFVFESF